MGTTALDRDDAAIHISEFVAGYASAATRAAYGSDLSLWLAHCRGQSCGLFEVRRADIESYARQLETRGLAPATVNRRLATITGFYRWALDEGLVTGTRRETSVVLGARPSHPGPPCLAPSSRTGSTRPRRRAATCTRWRACSRSTGCASAKSAARMSATWPRTAGTTRLNIVGKGDKPAVIPLPPRTVAAVEPIVAGRTTGPLLLTGAGTRMNRPAAARIVARLARRIGCGKHITPHSLRHSAITAAITSLNAGVTARRAGVRPPRRPPHHRPVRPCPTPPGPARLLRGHAVRRRRRLTWLLEQRTDVAVARQNPHDLQRLDLRAVDHQIRMDRPHLQRLISQVATLMPNPGCWARRRIADRNSSSMRAAADWSSRAIQT
jgi:integrase/recombinase XerD